MHHQRKSGRRTDCVQHHGNIPIQRRLGSLLRTVIHAHRSELGEQISDRSMYKSLCAIMLAATSVCSDARLATTLQPSMISMHILLSVCVLIAHRRARSSALVRSQGTGRWAVAIAWPKSLSNGFSPYAATHRLHASGRPLHHTGQVSADNPTPAQRCAHSHGRIQWSTSRNANSAIR